jgi:hypothetical protein
LGNRAKFATDPRPIRRLHVFRGEVHAGRGQLELLEKVTGRLPLTGVELIGG